MKLKVTQTRSTIGCQKDQIATMEALGLKKIRDSRIQEDNAVIRGMIHKVSHLVSVEKIEE
ncbi:50S ribosomal protein L30 [Eubacteriales bacterium mix99]|jgi:large subunit ribosomal protein L30